MHGNHFKHMLVGGAVLLTALLVAGLPFGTALPWALLVACPLMMGAMMVMMMRDGGHGHEATHDDHQHQPGEADRRRAPTRHGQV